MGTVGESVRNQGAGLVKTLPHQSLGYFPKFLVLSEGTLRELALLEITTYVLLTQGEGPLQRGKGK